MGLFSRDYGETSQLFGDMVSGFNKHSLRDLGIEEFKY
jgi:hypothetical protein